MDKDLVDDNVTEDESIPVKRVLSNCVVWRVLGRCLNFSDLKALRLVSRDFNSLVLGETNFKNRALINLFQSRLKPEEFGSTTVLWKNFKIQLHGFENQSHKEEEEEEAISSVGGQDPTVQELSLEEYEEVECSSNSCLSSSPVVLLQREEEQKQDWISPLLKCAESLIITVIPYHVYGPRKRNYPTLDVLLEAPDKLKKLVLDVNIFDTAENVIFTNLSEKIHSTLEKLVEFHIDPCGFKIVTHHNDSNFTDATGMLSAVMKCLQVLKVGRIVDEENDGLTTGSNNNELYLKIQNLIRITEENKSHVTHLHLEDMQLWSTPHNDSSLQSLVKKDFTNLKSVIIRTKSTEKNNLIDFFKRHVPMEEIDITILDTFPNELFDIIRSKSTNLRKLRIKTKGFEQSEENMWNFLTKCEQLESFQLDFPVSNRYSPNVESHNIIFMNLPKSIKKISLNGYFPNTEMLTLVDFGNLNPSLLTTLILKKCQEFVNDETLEWIFTNCKMLQIFTLTNNSIITDYGFTGIPILENNTELVDEEPTFSIKNLKGMKSLTLQSCSRLTDEICRHAIQFKELNYLDLSENDAITEVGVQEIFKNNPSLEILKTCEFDTFPMEEEIKKQHPRFQIHIFTDGAESDDGDGSLRHDLGDSDFSGPFDYDFYDDDYDEDDHSDDDYDHDNNYYNGDHYLDPFEQQQYEDHYK